MVSFFMPIIQKFQGFKAVRGSPPASFMYNLKMCLPLSDPVPLPILLAMTVFYHGPFYWRDFPVKFALLSF